MSPREGRKGPTFFGTQVTYKHPKLDTKCRIGRWMDPQIILKGWFYIDEMETHTHIYIYYLFIDVNIPRYLLRKNVLDTLHLLLQYLWSHWFPLLLYKGFRPRVSCTMIAMISMDFSFLGLDWNLTTRTGHNCKVKVKGLSFQISGTGTRDWFMGN